MRKIRIVSIVSLYLLVPVHLCAMDEDDGLLFNEIAPTTRPLLQHNKSYNNTLYNQIPDNMEVEKNNCCYIPHFISCLSNIFSCKNIKEHILEKVLKINKNKQTNISSLPRGVIWCIANFLDSTSILRLSGACKKFSRVFDENYWIFYLSKLPLAASYLTLKVQFSPSLNKKIFFSHLWYREGRISLAAKLNHPEASMLRQYGFYGAYIGKDQYLCSSGVIKYVSGKTDNKRTDTLKEAKNKADMEKNEQLRIKQEQIMKFNSKSRELLGYF